MTLQAKLETADCAVDIVDRQVIDDDDVLTPSQVSEWTNISVSTLQRLRSDGGGPLFVKLGKRRIGYLRRNVRVWLTTRIAASTSDARERGLAVR